MTREEFRLKIATEVSWWEQTDYENGIKLFNQIFDEHEAKLKARDKEIERLKAENKKYMEHITLKHLNEPIVFCASCSEKAIKLKEQQ